MPRLSRQWSWAGLPGGNREGQAARSRCRAAVSNAPPGAAVDYGTWAREYGLLRLPGVAKHDTGARPRWHIVERKIPGCRQSVRSVLQSARSRGGAEDIVTQGEGIRGSGQAILLGVAANELHARRHSLPRARTESAESHCAAARARQRCPVPRDWRWARASSHNSRSTRKPASSRSRTAKNIQAPRNHTSRVRPTAPGWGFPGAARGSTWPGSPGKKTTHGKHGSPWLPVAFFS